MASKIGGVARGRDNLQVFVFALFLRVCLLSGSPHANVLFNIFFERVVRSMGNEHQPIKHK